MASQVRQNLHKDCEAAINRQINLELHASYIYLSMSSYFERDDVALAHVAEFFADGWREELRHAERLQELMATRGGRLTLQHIQKPGRDAWGNGLEVMERALELQKTINQGLLDLYNLASAKQDPHLCIFLKTHFLNQQVHIIKELGDFVTNLQRLGVPGSGQGQYLFDRLSPL
uniref:Ferritin n=2 Tax=Callorhinchus milii TaxID=7868 RepID=V9LC80_CALMI|eukprot:gi/632984174/ref/XP_007909009.1/ PREDICTED: ferritin, higher subunit-like [Callorhinchus milii]